MSFGDKVDNKAEDVAGKVKEGTGKLTGDDSLRREGQADQTSAAVKGAAEKVKDAVKDAKDAITGNK